MASLTHTLLMLPRETPSYLKVAYSLRYKNIQNVGNCITRIYRVIQRVFSLIKEILYYQPSLSDFKKNKEKLNKDFEAINETVKNNIKPICIYFVSAHDSNGAILGNHLYYYHHYKIQNLQKHFNVIAKIVSCQNEMKDFMKKTKNKYKKKEIKYKKKEIKFVDIVSHGNRSSLSIYYQKYLDITEERLDQDLFSDCSEDATILLDACNTGTGEKNIANKIAINTPGRTILAPGTSMFFSKPIIRTKNKIPRVVSAVHGFAIFNAYKCKSFSYRQ